MKDISKIINHKLKLCGSCGWFKGKILSNPVNGYFSVDCRCQTVHCQRGLHRIWRPGSHYFEFGQVWHVPEEDNGYACQECASQLPYTLNYPYS